MTTNVNHENIINKINFRAILQKTRPLKKRAIAKTISLAVLLLAAMIIPFVAMSQTTNSAASISTQDYQLWVQPYLPQLEKIRAVLMTPYTIGNQHYGYDSTFGLVRGGNIEPSPAIKVSAGYQDVIVAIDNNLEGSYSLDYFNSASSVLSSVAGWQYQPTNIYGNVRAILAKPWDGIGGCTGPFTVYNYPSSFTLLDRREAEYGFISPYASTLESPGNHLGGIGTNCGTEGQTWFLPGYTNPNTSPSQPLIVTVFPSNQVLGTTGDLEELSFYIDQMYMQCQNGIQASCSQWRSSYLNAMSQFPFGAPREALHFIQVSRATVAWNDPTLTYNGMTAKQMLQSTITKVFSQAVGPHGGLAQSWGGSGDQTPEPNFQAMVAFDPRMPSWFVQGSSTTSSTSSTSHSTTSATTSHSTTTTGTTSSSTTTVSKSTSHTTTSIDSTTTSSSSSPTSSSATTSYTTTTNSSSATSTTSVSNVSTQTQSSATTTHSSQAVSTQSATSETTQTLSTNSTASTQTEKVKTTVANGSSTTVTTTAVQSTSQVVASSSTLASAIVQVGQPTTNAGVWGGSAALEALLVGLVPISILANKGRFRTQKAFRGWQW